MPLDANLLKQGLQEKLTLLSLLYLLSKATFISNGNAEHFPLFTQAVRAILGTPLCKYQSERKNEIYICTAVSGKRVERNCGLLSMV